jgi:hypothetical protein
VPGSGAALVVAAIDIVVARPVLVRPVGGLHLRRQFLPIIRDAGIEHLQVNGLGPLCLGFHIRRAPAVIFRALFIGQTINPSTSPGSQANAACPEAFRLLYNQL